MLLFGHPIIQEPRELWLRVVVAEGLLYFSRSTEPSSPRGPGRARSRSREAVPIRLDVSGICSRTAKQGEAKADEAQ
jgi:hypothetical protein